MAEISNLMGQFADKIMEQQTDIEMIQHHAYETKSNVSQVGGSPASMFCMITVRAHVVLEWCSFTEQPHSREDTGNRKWLWIHHFLLLRGLFHHLAHVALL